MTKSVVPQDPTQVSELEMAIAQYDKMLKAGWAGKYFTVQEIECHCNCGASQISPKIVELADSVRGALGVPLTCLSGTRCSQHNTDVEGRPGSFHLAQSDGLSYAMDLTFAKPRQRTPMNILRLYYYIESHARSFGACGIGLYDWGCHIDLRGASPKSRHAARWQGRFPWPRL